GDLLDREQRGEAILEDGPRLLGLGGAEGGGHQGRRADRFRDIHAVAPHERRRPRSRCAAEPNADRSLTPPTTRRARPARRRAEQEQEQVEGWSGTSSRRGARPSVTLSGAAPDTP